MLTTSTLRSSSPPEYPPLVSAALSRSDRSERTGSDQEPDRSPRLGAEFDPAHVTTRSGEVEGGDAGMESEGSEGMSDIVDPAQGSIPTEAGHTVQGDNPCGLAHALEQSRSAAPQGSGLTTEGAAHGGRHPHDQWRGLHHRLDQRLRRGP